MNYLKEFVYTRNRN